MFARQQDTEAAQTGEKMAVMAVKGEAVDRPYACLFVCGHLATALRAAARAYTSFPHNKQGSHLSVQPGSLLLPEATPGSPTGTPVGNTRSQVGGQGREAPLCCRPFSVVRGVRLEVLL